jgi:hypothetical protein
MPQQNIAVTLLAPQTIEHAALGLGWCVSGDPAHAHAGGLIDACTQAAAGVLTPTQAQHVLNQQLTYVIGILVAGGIASGLRAYMFNAAAERVMCRLRVQLFSQVSQLHCQHQQMH